MPTPAEIAALRTLALVGPATAGKTSLVEALLWKAGVLGAPGSVERGSTVCDHDPLEKKAQRSLNASLVHFDHRGVHVHLIDTPGAPDFLGQSLPALEAVETAAVVIGATTGIEPMAERMMQWAAQRGRDRIIVVNKIDAQGINLEALVAQIQAAFGKECLPVNLPAERGARVIDCFYNMAVESPATDFSSVAQAHRALVEQVVEVDAAFVERYLNDGDVDRDGAARAAGAGAARRPPDPDLLRLGRTGAGVAGAAGHHRQAAARPDRSESAGLPQRRGRRGQAVAARCPIPRRHVLAHVFKIAQDPYVGKMGVLRVHQGTLTRGHASCTWATRARPFKVGHLLTAAGQGLQEIARSAAPATSAPSPRWRSCTSTPCCTTRPKTTTST